MLPHPQMSDSPSCPLCHKTEITPLDGAPSEVTHFHCMNCDLRFLEPARRISPEEEKARYLEHNNDVSDPRYQKFVGPLYREIFSRVRVGAHGLDFGAGTGPVLARLLEKDGYQISLYDPYFWPDPAPLKEKYEFVFSSEVVEHFREPGAEFERMKSLLKDGGLLAIMTLLYEDSIDFQSWYYRKDPTHICFYSKKTFEWIANHYGFSELSFSGDRTVLLTLPKS